MNTECGSRFCAGQRLESFNELVGQRLVDAGFVASIDSDGDVTLAGRGLRLRISDGGGSYLYLSTVLYGDSDRPDVVVFDRRKDSSGDTAEDRAAALRSQVSDLEGKLREAVSDAAALEHEVQYLQREVIRLGGHLGESVGVVDVDGPDDVVFEPYLDDSAGFEPLYDESADVAVFEDELALDALSQAWTPPTKP